MKRTTIHFNHKPLQLSRSIVTDESVPGRQTYDATNGGHVPDYTLTPLILQPLIGLIDPDGVIPSGTSNGRLANIRWEQLGSDGKTWSAIATTDPDFAIVTETGEAGNASSDGLAGRLYVKRNADPGKPINLRFSADFIDPRDDKTIRVAMDYCVQCDNATAPQATVSLDCAHCVYNPLADPDLMTVSATVNTADGNPSPGDYELVWDTMDGTGAWKDLADPDALQAAVSPAADGQSVMVDRSLMGDECSIRVRLRHSYSSKPGDPDFNAMTPLWNGTPHAVCVIRRKLPAIDAEPAIMRKIPTDTRQLFGELTVRTQKGMVLRGTGGVLLPKWSTGLGTASGATPAMEVVSTELSATISTDKVHKQYGMVVDCDVVDAGPLKVLTDINGTVMTDGNGTILLFH